MDTRSKGQQAELYALNYLKKQGLKLITRNYYSRFGELDLIMQERQTLVFIEVRFRHHEQFSQCIETITVQKQKRMIKTAFCFLKQKNLLEKHPCRFDVVTISTKPHTPEIQWIKDAFQINEGNGDGFY